MTHPIRLGAVAAAAALLALSACSQGSATRSDGGEDGQVVVRYQEFSSNGGNEQNLEAIVAAFEEENPDIDVQVETTPYADYFTKLQTAVAGGTEADAFELNYENFVTYAESGALAELDVEGDAYTPSLLEAFQHDGAQVGLPESFSDVVLFYNKDLFAAAGVPEPTADWTWEDERAAAQALTDTAAGVWGDYQPATFHEFYKALAQAGGQFLTDDGSATAFNSPEGIAAATWLAEKSGTVMPTEAEGAGTPDFDSTLFREGKLAMWHSGIWMFGPLADAPFEWDVVVEPGDTNQASAMFTNGVVVSANSEHPEEAQAWLEFLTSSDTTVETRLNAGWELPPIADQDKLAPYLEQTPPANRQAVFDALDATVLPPVIVRQQEMQDAVTEELGNAAAGRKSVEQAVADAAARVDELL